MSLRVSDANNAYNSLNPGLGLIVVAQEFGVKKSSPMHLTVYVVCPFIGLDSSVPPNPDQELPFPETVQLVASEEDHVMVTVSPVVTIWGLADTVQLGVGSTQAPVGGLHSNAQSEHR